MTLDYHHGGLMRCCIQTLYERDDAVDRTSCVYCGNPMYRDDIGVWRWDKDEVTRRERERKP